MKKLILVRGPSGSGKTTYARTLVPPGFDEADCMVAADDYMVDADGVYDFDPSRLKEAHGKAQARVKELLMLESAPVIIAHNTFVKLWEMRPYLDMAKEYGYDVHVHRMTKRYGNVHDVPESVVDRHHREMEDYAGETVWCSPTGLM